MPSQSDVRKRRVREIKAAARPSTGSYRSRQHRRRRLLVSIVALIVVVMMVASLAVGLLV